MNDYFRLMTTRTAMRLTLSLLMLTFVCLSWFPSQQLPFRTYDILSDYVTCIEQDSTGFIWFGTDRGLSRYDGRDFVNYTQSDGLPDLFITCLYPDTGGAVRLDGD